MMNENSEWENPDTRTRDNVRYYGTLGKESLTDRILALDGELDRERFLAVALSAAGLFGMVMGVFGSRLWRVLAWASLPLLFLIGSDKWRPSDGLVRFLGLRSRREIGEEKFALKALRGDFLKVETDNGAEGEMVAKNSSRALQAVKA